MINDQDPSRIPGQPLPGDLWESEGWWVPVRIQELAQPIERDDIPTTLRLDSSEPMFNSNGAVNQAYLFPVGLEWFSQLVHAFADRFADTVAAGVDVPAQVDENAETILRDLVGQELQTLSGKLNTIQEVRQGNAWVMTERSPDGQPVPVADVQAALEMLRRDGAVVCRPEQVGYRSAFIGAVLGSLPGTERTLDPPQVALASFGAVPQSTALPDGPMDVEVKRFARVEQPALRAQLLDNRRIAPCALCGQETVAELLVAAHIKQRSVCSDAEKKEIRNIGMLACKLGCDDLYELGYVSVDATGTVIGVDPDPGTQGKLVAERIAAIIGSHCLAFTPANAHFFAWHRTTKFRGAA